MKELSQFTTAGLHARGLRAGAALQLAAALLRLPQAALLAWAVSIVIIALNLYLLKDSLFGGG